MDDKVILPVSWLLLHNFAKNLVLDESLSKMLSSNRMSRRVFAELMLDFDEKGVEAAERDGADWRLFDLKTKTLSPIVWKRGLAPDMITFTWGEGKSFEIPGITYSYQLTDDKRVRWHTRMNLTKEISTNQAMVKFFYPKFGVRLKEFVVLGRKRLDSLVDVGCTADRDK